MNRPADAATRVYVGCYTTPEHDRFGKEIEPLFGIGSLVLTEGGILIPAGSARAANPSFLARTGSALVAIEERDPGMLVAFDADDLREQRRVPTGGAVPGHVAAAPDGTWLVANYGAGSVSAVSLSGRAPIILDLPAEPGPVQQRQSTPHPHHVLHWRDDRWLVCDLGSDAVIEIAWDGTSLREVRRLRLPPGTGPRHAVTDGDRVFVTGELDARLHVIDAGAWRWVAAVPAFGRSDPRTPHGDPSHLVLRGALLYVATRGPDVIAVFDVSSDTPELVQQAPTGGHWPRHFAFAGDRLLIANERSGAITVFAVDAGGAIGVQRSRLDIPMPACVLPEPIE